MSNIIDKSFIEKNKEKLNWKGNGTQDNPIIINNNVALPQNLILKTEDLHIHLKNIDIGVLLLEKCQNIIVNDSIISVIKLKSCKNVIIINNLIRQVKLYFSKDIYIEDNRIYSFSNIRSFTILTLLVSSISGLISIISFIEELYFFRIFMFLILFVGLIILLLELIEKKSKIFLPKKFKKNEFIRSSGEKKESNLEFEDEVI